MDKLLLSPTDGNFLFFDLLHKKGGQKEVDLTADLLKELVNVLNSGLSPEAAIEIEKLKGGISLKTGSKVSLNELLNQVRNCFFAHSAKFVNELGIHKNHLILVCIFKYFLEVADERREFFRQRTVTFKQASTIVEKASKILKVILLPEKSVNLKPIKDDIDVFSKKQTEGERDEVNDKFMKETSPEQLYDLFVKDIQQ